jgi:hypothetical protein
MKHFLQNHLRLLVLVIAPIFLSACNPGDYIGGTGDPVPCNRPSVPYATITTTDTSGQPLADYEVTYNQYPNPYGGKKIICTTTSECDLQFEIPSDATITVFKEGFESTSLKVTLDLESGRCNAYTKKVIVKLKRVV